MPDHATSRRGLRDNRPALLWLLGTLFLLGTLCIMGGCTMLLVDPYRPFNPFPPPTLPPTVALPATPTLPPYPTLPPTWTPTATDTPTVTPTGTATATLPPTVTPTLAGGVSQPAETPLPRFVLQPGNPAYQSSEAFHPEAECRWLSVVGQVLEANGAPVTIDTPLFVLVRGLLAGQPVDRLAGVGAAAYIGPTGYEVKLADAPVASSQAVFVQLVDINGYALSDPFFFDTYDDCQHNVVIMNFVRQR